MTDEVKEVIAETVEKEADSFEADFNDAAAAREDTPPAESAGDLDDKTGAPAEIPDPNLNAGNQDAVIDKPLAGTDKPAEVVNEFEGWTPEQVTKYNELQKKHDNLDHRIKSDDGRVGAFQRKINNLETQIATIQKSTGEQPSNEEITAAMGTDKGWDEFKEDYPEVAKAIDARLSTKLGEVDTKIAPVVSKVNADIAHEAEETQTNAYSEVAKEFPTWQTAVQENTFHNWMAEQSPGIQALAGSDDTRDASLLISKFDEYRVANNLPTLRADHVPNDTVVDNAADEVAKRRAQQLEDGVTIESKAAQIDPNAESGSEFENAFNAFAARKEAKR